ncbi:hypothetical protein D3C78_1850480 [compost metagenome]
MVEAIDQRLAEERVGQVADFLIGNAGAGVIDMKYQVFRAIGFLFHHQGDLAVGGGDDGVAQQQ